MNARELVTGERPDDAVAAAKAADGRIFVGIELTTAELGVVLERLAHSHREAAAYLAGARLRRPRPRGRR